MTDIKTPENTRKIEFNENFNDFYLFYDGKKDVIYNEIYKIYEEIINQKKEYLFLDIQVYINDALFDFSVRYSMEKFSRLTTTILQYYEDHENYEMCNKIKKLEQSIT